MSDIATKLTYLNGTKQALKTSINNIGGDITSETTFRNYATELDTLYSNLPKVSGEGTSITLTPTLKGKLDYENNIVGYGDTEQTQYSGINLLPENKYAATQTLNGITYTNNGDGTFNIVGTATANTSIQIIPRNEIALEQGQAYYLWCNTAYDITNFNFTIAMYDGSTSTKYLLANGTYTPTATPTDERLQFYIASGNSVNKTNIKCMLVKGSTAPTNYEPYVGGIASPNPTYPQNIEVVTGTQTIQVSNSDNTESQTQTISLGDIELCKIGNYQDYLYKSGDKWYKKEQIYKIANKTNWSVDNIASNNRAVINLSGNGFPYSSDIGYATANAISNCFIGIAQLNQTSTTSINNVAINNANMYIKFADTINTKALVKEQLDSMTNLEIYYVVATPQDIEITNETLISQLNNLEKMYSYNGVTNINCSGNLSAILSVSAIKGE